MILLLIGIAIFTGICVFIFTYEGIDLIEHGTDLYMERLIKQVKELDALYVKMDAQRLSYLNIILCFTVFVIIVALTNSLIAGVCAAPSGIFISRFWVKGMRKRRLRLFEKQFIDGLGTISNALKSGLSFQQAIAKVAVQYPPPLSQELSMVGKEIALGVPLEQSLINLGKRVESEDLALFVTATNIVKDTGGNLSEMFDNISETLRERNIVHGKIMALTSQGRLQGIVIGLMPLVLGFVLYKIDPTLITPLFTDPVGWFILFLIILFEAIGAFFITKIIRIDI